METKKKTENWYVMKNDRVYGPLSYELVEQCLITGELTPDCHVSDSSGNWQPISEHESFETVVRGLVGSKREINTSSITLESYSTKSSSLTFTGFTGSTANSLDEKTKLEEGIVKTIEEIQINRNKPAPQRKPLRIAVDSHDVFAKKDAKKIPTAAEGPESAEEKTSPWVKIAATAAFLLLSVIGGLTVKAYLEVNRQQTLQEQIKKVVDAAEAQNATGDYSNALLTTQNVPTSLSRCMHIKEVNAKSLLLLKRKEEAREILVKVVQSPREPRALEEIPYVPCSGTCLAEAETMLAVLSLETGKFGEAESLLRNAVNEDDNFQPAIVDLGLIFLAKNNFETSIPTLMKSAQSGKVEASVSFWLAEAVVRASEKNLNPSLVSQVLKIITEQVNSSNDHARELLFAMATLETFLNGRASVEKHVTAALDWYPRFSEDQVSDPRIFHSSLKWKVLNRWGHRLLEAVPENSHVTALAALAALDAGERDEALSLALAAVKQKPRDGLASAAASRVYSDWGRDKEADDSLNAALSAGSWKLPWVMKAQGCINSDNAPCVKESVDKVLAISPEDPFAVAYGAEALGKIDGAKARSLVEKSLRKNATYIPLLEAKLKFSESKSN